MLVGGQLWFHDDILPQSKPDDWRLADPKIHWPILGNQVYGPSRLKDFEDMLGDWVEVLAL